MRDYYVTIRQNPEVCKFWVYQVAAEDIAAAEVAALTLFQSAVRNTDVVGVTLVDVPTV